MKYGMKLNINKLKKAKNLEKKAKKLLILLKKYAIMINVIYEGEP